jgi:hypothetical protein
VLLANSCYFSYKAINEPEWTEIFLGDSFTPYANECLYKSSQGNIVNLMSEEQQN